MSGMKLRLVAVLMLAALLAACGGDDKKAAESTIEVANTEPATAVMTQVKLLREGDFLALAKSAVPPKGFAAMKHRFEEEKKGLLDATPEERKEFVQKMKAMTAPDAEQNMMAKLQPMLDEYQTKYKAMVPMYVGMGQTLGITAIHESEDLTDQQKEEYSALLKAGATWAGQVDWGDAAKAQQAVAIVVDTARNLGIQSYDQLSALTFEQAMGKYGTVWDGARQLLAVYGLDVNKALESAKATTVSEKDGKALVKVDYSLFGKPLTTHVDLVEKDGHWYRADALQKLKELQDAAPASSSAAPATATGTAG